MWAKGTIDTPKGPVDIVSTDITASEKWEHVKCRISGYRNSYTVNPGLYAVGSPDSDSDVLISANYKLSFDHLRRSLKDMNAWILALDTKGINVWCAAGKGTFGTTELINKINDAGLSDIVKHRRVIVPQLGAVGISAQEVNRQTGFRVHYGPVYAKDVAAYISAGYKADTSMRRVRFSIIDRLVLAPMEIIPAMKKFPLFALIVLIAFGLKPEGIMFKDAFIGGLPYLLLGLISVMAGAFITPVMLPFIPFRSFALKGYLAGLAATAIASIMGLNANMHAMTQAAAWLWFPLASSYIALQFTGSTTYTGMSGVKKELRYGIPVYLTATVVAALLLISARVIEWRMA